jgi:putative flavoprotein involved in K+ transport
MSTDKTYHTIVIGGGQAGLAAGYYLAQSGRDFVILDGNSSVGDEWRKRWDSLRLFTPAQFDSLPGMPFPAEASYFPTKDEVADYLQAYAAKFQLPVVPNTKVNVLGQNSAGYHLTAGVQCFHATNVIVATGAFQQPYVPSFAKELDPAIVQLHSSAYCNPEYLPKGRILVVGAGNSGAEIGLELTKAGRQVWLSGRDVGNIPAEKLTRIIGARPYWWFISNMLTIDTPIGRKMQAQVQHHGNPLIRTDRQEILAAGIQAAPRLDGVNSGRPRLQDGQMLEVDAIVWATGFKPDYTWIKLPVFDQYGLPNHQRGVVSGANGLYFVGLHFQTGLTSALISGVGKDARYIVNRIQSE